MSTTRPDPRGVLTRSAEPPDVVLRYGDTGGHVIDVRLPACRPDDGRAPLAVLLHGGFWRAEHDRMHTRPLADALATLGWAVATPEYRRTGQPGGGWPGTFDDVAAALDGLAARIEEVVPRAVDTAGPVLVGHSAGGHLALWAAATESVRPQGLRGVLALAPVADLEAAWRLHLDGGAVTALLGGGPRDVPERYAAVDPLRLSPPPVPVVLLHGADDAQVPIALSEAYAAATGARLDVLDGVEHFGLIDPLSPAWPRVQAAVVALHESPRRTQRA